MPVKERSSRASRGRMLALVIAGVLIGALLVPPVSAHVGGWAHNWKKHIRPKTDQRYFTKSKANSRFIRGYEIVTEDTEGNSNNVKIHTVPCPEGKVAIGGGSGLLGNVANTALISSHPESPPESPVATGWHAEAIETGPGQAQNWWIRTYVICAFVST